MKLYKYTFKSPLCGSIHCDDLFIDTSNRAELDATEMAHIYNADSELSSFLDNNKEDLTEYLPDYFKSLVNKIEVGDYGVFNGELCLLAHVWATEEMTDRDIDDVQEYISGQYSDGWGEGLEQREWREDRVGISRPYFDPEEAEWDDDTEYTYATFYVHPWSDRQYSIELQYRDIEEIPDPDPVIQSAKCDLMENGGYRVRTVYRFEDEAQVLNSIKNSGLLYSDEFYKWVEDFGTFGKNKFLYLVVVNEGLYNKILPMLGVKNTYTLTDNARLFTVDAESGEVNLDEYLEDELPNFFKDLLNK